MKRIQHNLSSDFVDFAFKTYSNLESCIIIIRLKLNLLFSHLLMIVVSKYIGLIGKYARFTLISEIQYVG